MSDDASKRVTKLGVNMKKIRIVSNESSLQAILNLEEIKKMPKICIMKLIMPLLILIGLSGCGSDVQPPTLSGGIGAIQPTGPVNLPTTAQVDIPYSSGGSHTFAVTIAPLTSGTPTPTDLDFGNGTSCNYTLVLFNNALTVQVFNSCSVADCSFCPAYDSGYIDRTTYLN